MTTDAQTQPEGAPPPQPEGAPPPQPEGAPPPQPEGVPLIEPSDFEHPLHDAVVEACRTVFDPEIPVNIYDLGLIYTIRISAAGEVRIVMTLTAPGCPVAGEMPVWVQNAVEALEGVQRCEIEMTFHPQWGMDMMSDDARLELGFM